MRCVSLFVLAAVVPIRDARALAPAPPIRPESRVWITGASNIRRFTCEARVLAGDIELRGATTTNPVLAGENTASHPSLSVSVDKLDCGIGRMNHHLQDALHGAEHPSIEFRLTTYEVDLKATTPAARIAGVVTIAGVQRSLATTALIHVDTLGMLHVRGGYVIRPTDFGVSPPRRFGGLLRVRDRVAVHFDVALSPDCGATDAISRQLIESVKVDLEREPDHASHS